MIENISELLHSTDESDRRRAVALIAQTPSKESLAALVKIAEYDVSVDVRYFARRAINTVKDALGFSSPQAASEAIEAPAVDEQDFAALFSGQISEPARKIAIIRHIIDSNKKERLADLICLAQSEPDPVVISAILIAIGKFGSENEVNIIVQYLNHENVRVRANAVEALELIGSMKAYPYIVTKLSDEDNRVRGNAVSALRILGAVDTMRIVRLMAESGQPAMQATAAYALRFFPRDENIVMLLNLFKSGDETVRKNVILALEKYSENGIKRADDILLKIGESARMASGKEKQTPAVSGPETLVSEDEASRKFRAELKTKINDTDPSVRIKIIKEAMEKGILGAGQIFHGRLRSRNEKDVKVVATLVHALGKLEYKDAFDTLVLCLKDEDNRVRANAVEAIGLLIGREGKRDPVIHLVPFLKDSNNRARANAIIALAREKNVGIYATLLGMIRSGDMNMQRSAIYAIMELKDSAYYEFLAELESSPKNDEKVREKAKLMIERLAEEGIVVKTPDLGERGSKTFRIFVSSTFSDTKPERNYLQKKIFPELRNLCEAHGYRFQAVDLRWGVTSEAAYDQQTMKICLEEIKRSKKISPRPNFIILLGDRYGWLPLPYEIPQTEFEAAVEYLDSKIKSAPGVAELKEIKTLLERWYRLDDNADPSAYCLVARDPGITDDMSEEARNTARKKEEAEWNHAEAVLHEFFVEVCEKVNISQVTKLKLKLSATAQEIVEGAVLESTAKRHVFAFLRNIEGLPTDSSSRGYADLDKNGNLDTVSRNLLNNMKERLRKQIPNNIFEYETKWVGKKDPNNEDEFPITTGHIEKFGEDVKTALTNAILDRIASDEEIGPLEREIMSHDKFGEERSRVFIGRIELLKRINDYVNKKVDGTHTPLMLWGISGCGKTALLAKTIDELRKANIGKSKDEIEKAPVIISRFIGATADSADIRSLLKSICEEIKLKFNIAFEKEITSDMRYLPDVFKELLGKIPVDRKLTLFIDALDQLLEYENAHNVPTWLPDQIPTNVKIVLSTLKGYGCYESLENLVLPENIVEITGMSDKEGEAFLNTWLSSKKRELNGAGQRQKVIAAYKKCPYPLYFKLLLEEAVLWRSFDDEKRTKIGDGYESMIEVLFERLFRAHGKELVSRSLGYLAAAKNGLTDDEMIDALTYDNKFYDHFNNLSYWKLKKGNNIKERERIPVVIWSKLYFDLAPYLTEKAADGTLLLSFYHRQLGEVIKNFFLMERNKFNRHHVLAKYFFDQPNYIEDTSFNTDKKSVPNYRKCSELPFQLRKAKMFDEITCVLTDLNFIDTKCLAGMVFDLVEDYQETISALPEAKEHLDEEKIYQEKILKYIDGLTKYLSDPNKNPLPYIDSLKIMTEKEIDEKIENIKNSESLTRLEKIEEFARFINSSAHELIKHALNNPKFCIQQAYNNAEGGIVSFSAEEHIDRIKDVRLFLCKKGTRNPHNPYPALLRTFDGHTDSVLAIALSIDGRKAVSGSADKTLRVWDITSGKCLHILEGHTNAVTAVALTTDGRIAASVTGARTGTNYVVAPLFNIFGDSNNLTNTVLVWDIASGKCLQTLYGHTNYINAIALTSDGRTAVSGSDDKTLRVWDVVSGKCLRTLEGHTEHVDAVALTLDGRTAVSGGRDKTLRVWDIASGKCLQTLYGHTNYIKAVALTPDGRTAISGSLDNTLLVWDLVSGKCLRKLEGHTVGVMSIALSPNGRALSGSQDGTLRIWNIVSGKCLRIFEGHTESVSAVALKLDGRTAVSGSWDKTIRVWDVANGKCLHTNEGHIKSFDTVVSTPDGRIAVSRSHNNILYVWEIDSGKCLKKLEGHTEHINAVVLTPDGRIAVSGAGSFGESDKTLRVWDIDSGKCLKTLKGHNESVDAVVLTPDGRTVISGSMDKTIRIWDITSGKCLHILEGHTNGVNSVALTPDGRTLISGAGKHEQYREYGGECSNNKIRVWDVASGKCLHILEGHRYKINNIVLTPDGHKAVSSSDDRTLRVWDITSGKCLKTLKGHTDSVKIAVITPDGRIAVSGSDDRTFRVWDIARGTCLHIFESCSLFLKAVMLMPDGQTVVTGSENKTLHFWDISNGQCLSTFPLSSSVNCVSFVRNCLIVNEESGKVNFIELKNFDLGPYILTAWHDLKDNTRAFGCTHCRKWSEIPTSALDTEIPCPKCGKRVKLNPFVIEGDWREIERAWNGSQKGL